MHFNDVLGQTHLKNHLLKSVENNRIPHAQLFVGSVGSGILPMAIAYAQAILTSQYQPGSPEEAAGIQKVTKLAHPDLHFSFPMNTTDKIKKNPVSSYFLEEWRSFVNTQPYGSLYEWLEVLGIDKKQGNIGVDEAKEISKTLIHKPFEGGYQVMIIWMADRMNTEASNKILKLIEEPPKNTIILLLTEQEEMILGTIRSRCQKLQFPALPDSEILKYLIDNQSVEKNKATKVSKLAHGNLNIALQLLNEEGDDLQFEKWFVEWVRTAFKAKGNKAAINPLLQWSVDLASQNRETQKKFLAYCSTTFRQAMLKNYKADSLIYFDAPATGFSIDKFAPFIHQNNIVKIFEALEEATYHVSRNGNGKIIFTDLSIKLTRLIHAKS